MAMRNTDIIQGIAITTGKAVFKGALVPMLLLAVVAAPDGALARGRGRVVTNLEVAATVDRENVEGRSWRANSDACGSVVIASNCDGFSTYNYLTGTPHLFMKDVCGWVDGELLFRFTPASVDNRSWYAGKQIVKINTDGDGGKCVYSIAFNHVLVTPPFDMFGRRIISRDILGFSAVVEVEHTYDTGRGFDRDRDGDRGDRWDYDRRPERPIRPDDRRYVKPGASHLVRRAR